MLEIIENPSEGTLVLTVRVQPRASNNEIAGEMAGVLKIRLQAPAVEDRANEALIEFLAELLKIPKSAVRLLSGHRSRLKRLEIRGVAKNRIEQLILQDA